MLMRSWWVLAMRGAVGVLFGVLAFAMPDVTLLALMALFAIYAVLAGTVAVAGAMRNRRRANDWWVLLLLGLVGIGAGVLAALRPALTALALVIVIGVNALITGVLEIALAINLRKFIEGEWLIILGAVTSIRPADPRFPRRRVAGAGVDNRRLRTADRRAVSGARFALPQERWRGVGANQRNGPLIRPLIRVHHNQTEARHGDLEN